jgi:hypothetical protein
LISQKGDSNPEREPGFLSSIQRFARGSKQKPVMVIQFEVLIDRLPPNTHRQPKVLRRAVEFRFCQFIPPRQPSGKCWTGWH